MTIRNWNTTGKLLELMERIRIGASDGFHDFGGARSDSCPLPDLRRKSCCSW